MAAIKDPQKHINNAFSKHIREHYTWERNVEFKMEVTNSFRRPLERQVREGIEIYGADGADGNILMNSKMDHYQPAIRRIVFTNQLRDLQPPAMHQ